MSDAKKKKQETWLIQKGSVSFNNDLLRRGLSRTGFRAGMTRLGIEQYLADWEAVLQHRN